VQCFTCKEGHEGENGPQYKGANGLSNTKASVYHHLHHSIISKVLGKIKIEIEIKYSHKTLAFYAICFPANKPTYKVLIMLIMCHKAV
jgi:hypothetical protein